MKKLLVLFIAIGLLAACSNKKEDADEVKNLISLADFETLASSFVDELITVEGRILHVCGSGGKLFLVDENGDYKVKVEAPEGESLERELEDKHVSIVGYVRELRIDEAYLQEWEAEIRDHDHDVHGCQHEGEDHSHEGEHQHGKDDAEGVEAESNPRLERIKQLREEIEASGKGYISFFHIEYKTISPIEEVDTENDEE